MSNIDRPILEKRTRRFHIDIIKMCRMLPRDAAGFETSKQVIRSGGSVGSNYRASRRAKSDKDYSYKIDVVVEESDESHYWLQVIYESELLVNSEVLRLINEANELTAIFVTMSKTLHQKNGIPKPKRKKRNDFGNDADQTAFENQ